MYDQELTCPGFDKYTKEEITEMWEETAKTVEKYSDELVEQWNKEIDGLLTFVSIRTLLLLCLDHGSFLANRPDCSRQF